ncbi:stage II sporulation protein M [Paenibacillus mendelii]|uniref:Stage II sporulation protein M n=1 Tax=Paenibacillus mendelii TaxID=206163 RepID=A0ABV6JDA3_9BACL|nr:stage II sporulation protein M [Paenibacillus mendelii]MCQ6563687.1 stage II sporulation protein M [Paenibacillus mendelii]
MFAWRELTSHMKSMKHYLAFSTIVLLAGMVVGGTNPVLDTFIRGQIDGLRQVAETIDSSANPTIGFMVFIFFNNVIKSILVMYLGALFGIIPILFLAVNGMILGYFVSQAAAQGGDVLFTIVVKGLLPHGILEIPAILIACAYGMRFGKIIFQGIGAAFGRRPGWGKEVERFIIRTVPIMVLLVVMLLAAAVIESTFTVWLLSK